MLVVGIGGTTRERSTSELALRAALGDVEDRGIEVKIFAGRDLAFPLYDPSDPGSASAAGEFVETVRAADGVIFSSPGYHGTVSGMFKNACDYLEETARDDRPYLSDLPIGCISVAYGWQAAVNTLRTMRDVAHALRGYPTPYGAAINASTGIFVDGVCVDAAVRRSLETVGSQVADAVKRRHVSKFQPLRQS